eukprot:CAMPEP_0115334418 /NCGR_PEP_ID=MMETSP0270-20121206/87897_1 /TAXON_ID=71861 /ORGANISM="Scrippsiella trochoidea, Strain CCMP3099" /LENGTH=69 /DNA_ID=CAMNT_0002755393 /DNA_START=178 /DNA_END=385 /DNA_ORIENTATION=-
MTVVSIEENETDTIIELCICNPHLMYDITTKPPLIVPSPEAHAHEIDGGDKKGVKLPAHRDVPAKDLQP